MSLFVVLLLAIASVVYVVYPLFRRQRQGPPTVLAALSQTLVVSGVVYETEDEWAVDRALGKADAGQLELQTSPLEAVLEAEIERQVAALRTERREARASKKRALCENCGKPFQSGDRFCARCGTPHPNVCSECGERHRPEDRFCTRCGAALSGGYEQ